jgi:hypothetical protein
MRFKEFEVIIHGEFETPEDELDLRGSIAKSLGGNQQVPPCQPTQQVVAKEPESEEQTIQNIENGDAKWAPPLQQQLDTLKQSVSMPTIIAAKEPMMEMCRKCGHLIFNNVISESKQTQLQETWSNIARKYTNGLEKCKSNCEPFQS